MKRILAVMIAVLMFISLVGCGESDDGGVELFEKEDPRKDLIVGEWYYGNEESDEPDIIFGKDGKITSILYEADMEISWEFEDGYIISSIETGETSETFVPYVDEYMMLLSVPDSSIIRLYKEPTQERIAQYQERIIGSWYSISSDNENAFIFNKDGTFDDGFGGSGTWSISDETLILNNSDGSVDEYPIRSITKNTLEFEMIFSESASINISLYSDPQHIRDIFKDVQPKIYEGTYTSADTLLSDDSSTGTVKFSNFSGRTCDITYTFENPDGTSETGSGKGELWYVGDLSLSDDGGLGGYIMDYIPNDGDKIKNAGIYETDVGKASYYQYDRIFGNIDQFDPISIDIPDGTEKIRTNDFKLSYLMTDITIPESVTNIDKNSFERCHNLTIHAPAGSYAEKYAKENNIPFEAE